jgi:hypothetical protein
MLDGTPHQRPHTTDGAEHGRWVRRDLRKLSDIFPAYNVSLTGVSSYSILYGAENQVNIAFTGATNGSHSLSVSTCADTSNVVEFTTPVCQVEDTLISETSTAELRLTAGQGVWGIKFRGHVQAYGPYTSLAGRSVREFFMTDGPDGCDFEGDAVMPFAAPAVPNGDGQWELNPFGAYVSPDNGLDTIAMSSFHIAYYMAEMGPGGHSTRGPSCRMADAPQTMKINACSAGSTPDSQ